MKKTISLDGKWDVTGYGLNGENPLTQKEVANELGISRSYVSRIEKRVLKELRDKF